MRKGKNRQIKIKFKSQTATEITSLENRQTYNNIKTHL